MTRWEASFLSRLCFGVCFVLLPSAVEAILKDECPEEARIILSPKERRDKPMPVSMRNMTLLERDDFPRNLTWVANGSTYGCICDVFTCLRLCCPRGSVLTINTCTPTDGDFVDQWPDIYFTNLTLKPSDDFFPIVEYPCGEDEGYELDPEINPADEFHLLDDRLSIHIAINNFFTHKYCLQSHSTAYVPILCFPEEDTNSYVLPIPVQVAGFVISILFLLVTLAVYVLLPELNTIHGLTLRCYVASFCVSLIFLVIERLSSLNHSIWLCRFIGLGIHFTIIASFIWLNVICVDIWRTFGFRNTIHVIHSDQKRGRFLHYSIYAWGIPSLFTGVCIFMELVPGLSKDLIRPEIASSNKCWFTSWKAELAYHYGPMTVILICNLIIFVATAMNIIWHQRIVAPRLVSNQSKHHDAKKWIIVYFKLFIVMGINFIMEVISWWWRKPNLKYLWYIADTVNTLQGFTIFLILVCKRNVIRSLKKRFNEIRRHWMTNELSLDSSSANVSGKTQNNTSSCQTTEFHDPSTSESLLSSNTHRCSSMENSVEARDYQ